MNVLVVGSGGREHAIAWKLCQSPHLDTLYCAPGNGGTASLGKNVPVSGDDLQGLFSLVQSENIGLVVVGPEAPLANGIVDRFREAKIPIIGPNASAARLEASKAFCKEFLARHHIPTAAYAIFQQPDEAEAHLRGDHFAFPVVIKADGLAAGKGVFICEDLQEAVHAIDAIMRQKKFGEAGSRIVVEEFLQGEEASFMVFTDGKTIEPMVPSQDHKKIFENDEGPNTGGMGAFSTSNLMSEELRNRILKEIIEPTIQGLDREQAPFQGILYAGLMLTEKGPQVLEFNVRLGDPEAQVVLPRMETDLLEVFRNLAEGRLSQASIKWRKQASVCVVVAAGGYPGSYEKDKEISGIEMAEEDPAIVVFHAGTRLKDSQIFSDGGRVLGVTSLGDNLENSIIKAYEAVNKIHFESMYYRRDIAAKGLQKLER